MYFVLERKDFPGRFMFEGANPDSKEDTDDLERAKLFQAVLERGVLKTTSELPDTDMWVARSVSLYLG